MPNGYLFPPAGAYTVSATTTETENARSAAIIVNVVDVEFVVPSGDPVNNPSSSNEFVFDNTPTGTLTITLSAKVTPASAIDLLKDNAVFEIDNITGSTKTWDVANPNGKAVVSGDSLTATVTFSGLPAENSSFGKKAAKITCSGSGLSFEKTNDFEVFFPRNATNHPGGQSGSPNWFHYWNQVYPYSNIHYIPDAGFGQVPAMRFWSYTLSRDKTRIEIGSSHPAKGRAYGIGKDLSGIDCYIGTVIHEKKHVEQISLADALLPTYGQDSFRYGWSWNIMPHNHWTKGADGAWGIANVDDDGNGIVDDAKSNTPFEPGRGDDINLTNPLYYDWPNSWTLPGSPYLSASPYPVEGAAVEATDMSMDDNKYARSDWGAPGKNHGKLNEWNN